MRKCKTCGKKFDVLWPDLWRYKISYGPQVRAWYCSWKCMRADEKKGEQKKMARHRKDGKPVKKPEKKATVEVADRLPEEQKVELVYDECIAEEYRREQAAKAEEEKPKKEPLEVCGVFSRVIRYGKYIKHRDPIFKKTHMMRMTGNDIDIILSCDEWIKLCGEIGAAMDQLGLKAEECDG